MVFNYKAEESKMASEWKSAESALSKDSSKLGSFAKSELAKVKGAVDTEMFNIFASSDAAAWNKIKSVF